MINYTQLKTNLRTWAVAQTTSGVDVVFGDQNAPSPGLTYIVLKIASVKRIGEGTTSPIDEETGLVEVRGTRELTVRLDAIGEGANEELEKIVGSFEDPIVLMDLQADKLVYVDQLSDVIDLTGIIGPSREERASVDLRFRISTPYETSPAGSDVGIIEHVVITNTGTGQEIIVNPPLEEA